TTMAISTRISAYSTNPCPSSLAKKLRIIASDLTFCVLIETRPAFTGRARWNWIRLSLAQAGVDRAEDLADLAAKQGQNTNDNNCDQHQDQCVLNQTLTILFGEETAKHCCGSPFVVKCSSVM